ncbi:hypothetical protein HNQ74_001323 [Bartonella doshiae]|nr:hypothetical protein [Bartonella doshiae]
MTSSCVFVCCPLCVRICISAYCASSSGILPPELSLVGDPLSLRGFTVAYMGSCVCDDES